MSYYFFSFPLPTRVSATLSQQRARLPLNKERIPPDFFFLSADWVVLLLELGALALVLAVALELEIDASETRVSWELSPGIIVFTSVAVQNQRQRVRNETMLGSLGLLSWSFSDGLVLGEGIA